MKSITKYVANNGKEFSTEKDALEEDALIVLVDKIMSQLKPKPNDEGCNFSNGYSFVQQDRKVLDKAKKELLQLVKSRIQHKWIDDTMEKENTHPSWVARLLGDYGIEPLERAWYRFYCIDKECREWGQPYFASNPDKSPALEMVSPNGA